MCRYMQISTAAGLTEYYVQEHMCKEKNSCLLKDMSRIPGKAGEFPEGKL